MYWTIIALLLTLVVLTLVFRTTEWIVDNASEGKDNVDFSGNKFWKYFKRTAYTVVALAYIFQGSSYIASTESPHSAEINVIREDYDMPEKEIKLVKEKSLEEKAADLIGANALSRDEAKAHFDKLPNQD